MTFRSTLHRTILFAMTVSAVALGCTPSAGVADAAPVHPSSMMAAAAVAEVPRLNRMVVEAKHQTTLGIAYSYGGGHGPKPAALDSHVDCSGFVREMFGYAFGVDIGSGSGDTIVRLSGKFVLTAHPVPGDVALFGHGGHAPAYHAGIYIGLVAGHPAIVAAPATGSNIKVQQWFDRYWHADLMGYWHYRGPTAVDSGPRVLSKTVGRLDTLAGVPGGFRLAGWAVDPLSNTVSTTVGVTVDGRKRANLPTNVSRADVNRATPTSGVHGFDTAIPTPIGRHTVCVVANPAGTPSAAVSLGCRVIAVPGPVLGHIDSVRGGARAFAITGWADDPADPGGSSAVRITGDGRTIATIRASGTRPEVNSALRISGHHGFAVTLGATAGRHTVCAIALPLAASYERSLGCATITVTG